MHIASAKGYQGYKSNFGCRVPFDRELRQISYQNSVFGFAERNTPIQRRKNQWRI